MKIEIHANFRDKNNILAYFFSLLFVKIYNSSSDDPMSTSFYFLILIASSIDFNIRHVTQ